MFRLAICLKVECNRKLSFDIEEVAKQKPEFRCKNSYIITNDRVKKIVVLYYYIDNHLYKSQSIDGNFNQLIIYYFGQVVDNNKNQIITVILLVGRYRQTYNKIY